MTNSVQGASPKSPLIPDLLPCPFCGNAPYHYDAAEMYDASGDLEVMCLYKGCTLAGVGIPIKSWNTRAAWSAAQAGRDFQSRVKPWMDACFGASISADRVERNHRFLEEALELVQACGSSRDEAIQLVDYVFSRPVGEPSQEVGGVEVTLAALCLANGLNKHDAAETELARVWTKIDQIRAKQAAKPRGSVLPISPSYAPPTQPSSGAKLGRFGHHPVPAIDFCVEVDALKGLVYEARHGMADKDAVTKRIATAMMFIAGGNEGAVKAKRRLRELEADFCPYPQPSGGEGGE